MKSHQILVFALVAVAIGCASKHEGGDAIPPARSYEAVTQRVKFGNDSVTVLAATVTSEFFQRAATQPLVGRLFVDGDYLESAGPMVVLSHALWVGHFGSARNIVGQEIEIEGRRVIVLGVMPATFDVPKGAQLWTPKRGGSVR